MLWKRVQKSPAQVRFRPNLDSLEDRLVLSPTTFSVDDTQSSLVLSGNVAGVQLQQQGTGSLIAAYTGAFVADVDYSPGFPNAITFMNGGNDVVGENSGNWAPRADGTSGTEPAVYGGQANFLGLAQAAVRNVNVGASSDTLPLTSLGDGVTYSYANSQTLTINSANAAYTHPFLGHGTFNLAGQSKANQADSRGNTSYLYDLNSDGTNLVLVTYIDIAITGTISGFNYELDIDGVIVSSGSLGTGPAVHGGHHGGDATLGTALTTGAHSMGDALLANSVGNLSGSGSLALEQLNLATSQSQSQIGVLGTANSQMPHQATADQLDAAFVEMSPIETLRI
jgi:hypothetical protein